MRVPICSRHVVNRLATSDSDGSVFVLRKCNCDSDAFLPNSRQKPAGSPHIAQVARAKTLNKLPLLDGCATYNHEKGCDPGYCQIRIGGDQRIGDHRSGKGHVKGMPHPVIGAVDYQSGIAARDYSVGQIVAESAECPNREPDNKFRLVPPARSLQVKSYEPSRRSFP